MPADRAALGFGRQTWTLFRMQLLNWRWSWRQMVLTGMLAPVITIAMLGTFARPSGPEAAAQVLAGSLTMALLFQMQDKVSGSFAFLRHTRAFDFYASLPISREAMVLATLAAFAVLAVPALLVTVAAGVVLLDLPLPPPPLLLPALLVGVLTPAGLGAWIGTRSSSLEQAASTSLACTLTMVAVGPVTVPAALLPQWLVWLGHANPGTHLAALLRRGLVGDVDRTVLVHLALLAAAGAAVWLLLRSRMPWRPSAVRGGRPPAAAPSHQEGQSHDRRGLRCDAVADREGGLG